MKYLISFFLCAFFAATVVSSQVAAARFLPRFQKSSGRTASSGRSASSSAASSKYVSPRLRADRKALLVSFKNLRDVSSIEYILTYQSNGVEQGVQGTIDGSDESSLSRELLFGTESSGAVTYHTNITNMKFEITINLSSGAIIKKVYRVRL